ncbi:MAG: hypothetical protein ISS55_09805 [Dehalococcoidales bacterium]|nr:hypothetical protein [Dehalococcoidales bacterium]
MSTEVGTCRKYVFPRSYSAGCRGTSSPGEGIGDGNDRLVPGYAELPNSLITGLDCVCDTVTKTAGRIQHFLILPM